MGKRQRYRFCLRIVEGANAGLGAGSWRLWVHKNDVYVAAAEQADTIKASLHESGRWRVAYTSEHMAQDKPLWRSADRAAWKFDAPPVVDGVQSAFVIATVRAALTPCQVDARETVVALDDRWDRLTGVEVVITEPHIAFDSDRLVFPTPLPLTNGRLVWLTTFHQTIRATTPEPAPAGQMVRVLTPSRDAVSCPGYLIVGVNVA
ncbi:hypothetical protein G7072_04035 [Nocardioides sp. HDW12B]|uniref:hypothetical protein n=1 Tax=Nocardioides sp. HDW12B TaxID=2714939 RepID=UPI00140BC224|nr:hypothetical protein [Nocardioides sp. HDW12B]QIK65616.1 hypothetical protein G7072_04035 [Nocardioides sp. HDW12B]